jgi:hypothetical protein
MVYRITKMGGMGAEKLLNGGRNEVALNLPHLSAMRDAEPGMAGRMNNFPSIHSESL